MSESESIWVMNKWLDEITRRELEEKESRHRYGIVYNEALRDFANYRVTKENYYRGLTRDPDDTRHTIDRWEYFKHKGI